MILLASCLSAFYISGSFHNLSAVYFITGIHLQMNRCFADQFSRCFADILQIFCRHFADILQTFCRYSADILQIFCRHSTDILQTFYNLQLICRLPADYLQICCNVFADLQQTKNRSANFLRGTTIFLSELSTIVASLLNTSLKGGSTLQIQCKVTGKKKSK